MNNTILIDGIRYRKCLYAVCPYGKDGRTTFRRRPLKKDLIRMGGGEMRV
jgi:hypothetical protein